MLYCPNFFWNVLQVWMTGKDVYLQMTWSWPDKTWNILCSYCLQWNTSQSKFRNHYFLFLFAFSILSQLFLIWGCKFWHNLPSYHSEHTFDLLLWKFFFFFLPYNNSQLVTETVWLPLFFKISSFVFHSKKKVIQVWDNMKVIWQNLNSVGEISL